MLIARIDWLKERIAKFNSILFLINLESTFTSLRIRSQVVTYVRQNYSLVLAGKLLLGILKHGLLRIRTIVSRKKYFS